MEIKTQDLRLNNLFVDRKGQICKVERIEEKFEECKIVSDTGLTHLPVKPIQLTEEVLLMCGAVKNSEKIIVNEYEYYEDFWINEFFSVLFIYSNYGNVQQFEIVYNSHGNNVYGIKNTEFLHTLQNVLHLTGEELTYNHSPSI